MPIRIAVLASGGGSNLQAVMDHFAALGDVSAGEIVLVASDRAEAGALERARARGISHRVLDATASTTGLASVLAEHGVGLVVLAGYLRLVPNDAIAAFRGRMVNVHPGLLPAFGGPGMYGERVHAAVLASGARVSGATVHFADEAYDHGPIIAQWPVPVLENDTPATLGRRVLAVEHAIYPRVIQAVAAGQVRLGADGRAHGWRAVDDAQYFGLNREPSALFRAVEEPLTAPHDQPG